MYRSPPKPAPKPWGPTTTTTTTTTSPTVANTKTSQVHDHQAAYNASTHSNDNMNNNNNNLADITAKVNRLSEMGFSRESVQQALLVNNGDENAALNSLLAGDAVIVP